ncbi:MAG: hypothetical protein CUN55_05025 [Phototrophicales bacterium]|nr:MAG: hypothetical protein CUN55_05025 [Phototrophicales bacterium]
MQVATASAPDSGYVTYIHPSGVFSIRIPPNWIPNDLPDDNGVRVEFSTLENDQSVVRLTVYVVNTGAPMTREAFLQTTNAYLPPQDFANFNWRMIEAPVDQPDGSRRVVGIRDYPIIGSRALNVFMQASGRYFVALEADVTDATPTTIDTLTTVVNTFRINDSVQIAEGSVAGGVTYSGNIGFESYAHWQDSGGGFNITGLVVNNQDVAIEAVRITGYLFDARGNQLSEESIILPVEVLRPDERAPFRLRFEGGRPSSAVRYELHAAARIADFALDSFYPTENFEIIHTADFNDTGNLVVRGQIVNRGTRLVRAVKIIIAVFDENNNVIAAETQFISKDQLLPNEVDDFEVVFYDLGGAAVRYSDPIVVGTAE